MNTTLRKAIEISEAVRQLLDRPLKGKVAWKMTLATKEVRALFNEFQDTRTKLVREYGEPGEGGNFRFTPESGAAFTRELEELLDEPVEFADFKIDIADIGELEINGNVLAALEPFIVEKVEA